MGVQGYRVQLSARAPSSSKSWRCCAGLKKRGIEVSVLERVRQVGPNKAGAKGSYTVYRLAEAG